MKRDTSAKGEPDFGAEATMERGEQAARDAMRDSSGNAGSGDPGSANESAPGGASEGAPDGAAEAGVEGEGSWGPAVNDLQESQYLDQLQRLRAEFDNFRKRTLRDKEQWWRQAKADLLAELLPVLDDAERARAFAVSGQPVDADGLLQILRKLNEKLTQLGLEAMETGPGTPFDPEFHEAFMTTPSAEVEEGQIVSTLESGYRFEGEIIRRSKVSVSAGRPTEDP